MPFIPPVFRFWFSPTTNPLVTPSWVEITQYVLECQFHYGRQFELNRMEAGTAQFKLSNVDRRFDPENTSGPYYPNLKVMRRFHITADYSAVTYTLFTGFIEEWPPVWEAPGWAEVDCTAVDGFEAISNATIVSSGAVLTTGQGGNKDITYTSNAVGSGNNDITIQYVNGGSLSVDEGATVLDIKITIVVGVTTANAIIAAVNADVLAGGLVTATLAPGSSGVGTPAAFGPTNLAGGTFVQELTGSRISKVLDAIGWPSAHRSIDAGQYDVAPRQFTFNDAQNAKDHVNNVENSELGYTFVDGRGYVIYHDGTHRTTQTLSTVSQGTFCDDGSSALEYDELSPSFDKTYIYNSIAISPYAVNSPQLASDQTSIDEYMIRSYPLSSELANASDSLSVANLLLSRYKEPRMRFASMKYIPMNNDTMWLQALNRGIGDRITVKRTPPHYGGGSAVAILLDCYIESIAWDINPGDDDVEVTYELSPVFTAGGGGGGGGAPADGGGHVDQSGGPPPPTPPPPVVPPPPPVITNTPTGAGIGTSRLGGSYAPGTAGYGNMDVFVVDLSDPLTIPVELPSTRALFYRSAVSCHTTYDSAIPHSSGSFLRDGGGNLLENTQFSFAGDPCNILDVSNPAMSTLLGNECVDWCQTYGYSGIWLDDVVFWCTSLTTVLPSGWSNSTWASNIAAHVRRTAKIVRDAGFEFVVNASGFVPGDSPNSDNGVNELSWWTTLITPAAGNELAPTGLTAEYWMQSPIDITDVRKQGVSFDQFWNGWRALHGFCHTNSVDFMPLSYAAADDTYCKYIRGTFLLDFNNTGALLSGTGSASPYGPVWCKDMGAPSGAATESPSGVWTRVFANGTVVVNSNVGTATIS